MYFLWHEFIFVIICCVLAISRCRYNTERLSTLFIRCEWNSKLLMPSSRLLNHLVNAYVRVWWLTPGVIGWRKNARYFWRLYHFLNPCQLTQIFKPGFLPISAIAAFCFISLDRNQQIMPWDLFNLHAFMLMQGLFYFFFIFEHMRLLKVELPLVKWLWSSNPLNQWQWRIQIASRRVSKVSQGTHFTNVSPAHDPNLVKIRVNLAFEMLINSGNILHMSRQFSCYKLRSNCTPREPL